ncbi:MAG TPA: glycosyltransferase family 2 protein [Gemmatimonadaceae bacterium]|nr:glycosyltransferase family 2 protein [Gemmatimonadaceae bacterium]
MSGRDASVLIVLAAYNGARFIGAQIESIRAQTWREWRLLVRDDGSSDATLSIVRHFAEKDHRITVLEPDGLRAGPWGNFGILMQHGVAAGCEYLLLSDQDDVWVPDKIERSLMVLQAREKARGHAGPVLVHSDLKVVDDELRPIFASYRAHQRVLYDRVEPLRTLLLHNAPMGCTIAVNRALMDFALPLPAQVPHDWWLAQCAAATGDVLDIPDALVLYRQHGGNVVGSTAARTLLRRVLGNPVTSVPRLLRSFRAGLRQATELSRRVSEKPAAVPPSRASAVHAYAAAFQTLNPVRRLALLASSGVRPQRAVSHPIFYALAMLQPRLARN